MNKLSGVQALRAIAALAVVFHHILWLWSLTHPNHPKVPEVVSIIGSSGVHIFFVISGFIMLYTTRDFGSSTASMTFLWRRVLRIAPLYWICTALVLLLALTGAMFKSVVVNPASLLSSFLFLPLSRPIMDVGWTLQYEIYFYLLFGFSLMLPRKIAIFSVPVMLLTLLGLATKLPECFVTRFLSNPICLEFVAGMLVALCAKKLLLSNTTASMIFFGALGIHVALTGVLVGKGWASSPLITLVWGAASVTYLIASIQENLQNLTPKFLLLLGDASYSIYLTHWLLVPTMGRIGRSLPPTTLALFLFIATSLSVSVACGLCTYFFVEKRIGRQLKRYGDLSHWRHPHGIDHSRVHPGMTGGMNG